MLAIENARGGTLADLIKRRYSGASPIGISEEDCAKIIKGILQGLKSIHSQDFLHRDLKPSNVVVDDINNLESVKLVDFGLAIKFQMREILDDSCGTLVYQAPEQMLGDTSYGKPVDLWAVGFIMFELLSGKHPLWTRKEDKNQYREKLKNLQRLDYSKHNFSE